MKEDLQLPHYAKILAKFYFNEQMRAFELLDASFAKTLTDFRLGHKRTLSQHEKSTAWVLTVEEFVYLISCLDMPTEIVTHAYTLMTPYEIVKTQFYIWIRKRSRLVRPKTDRIYKIYSNVDNWNNEKPSYCILVAQSDDELLSVLGPKPEYSKIAVVRNRDIVVFDVIS